MSHICNEILIKKSEILFSLFFLDIERLILSEISYKYQSETNL